jgi:hypothetical protein
MLTGLQKLFRVSVVAVLASLVCYALFRGFVLTEGKAFLEFSRIVSSSIAAVTGGIVAWKAFKSPSGAKAVSALGDWLRGTVHDNSGRS